MFHKVMFTRPGHGATAGIVIDSATTDPLDIDVVSRLFPAREAVHMHCYHVSPGFAVREAATAYVFPFHKEGADRKTAALHQRWRARFGKERLSLRWVSTGSRFALQ